MERYILIEMDVYIFIFDLIRKSSAQFFFTCGPFGSTLHSGIFLSSLEEKDWQGVGQEWIHFSFRTHELYFTISNISTDVLDKYHSWFV